MEASVPINGWTTSLDCLAWSHDNVIAVGVRDGVALLAPRTDTSSDDEPFWKIANLEVGNFSLEEIPTREPLPWSYFSIGQEISERHVVSVQWSPPGLGTFGRCVLAVLFANQVVAIYDCDGRLEAKESWSRVNLINKTLEDAIPNMQIAPQPSPRSERAQQERSLRITSFCWLPSPETHNAQDPLQARLSKKTYLLAVCDENAELRILRVHPPLNLIKPDQGPWRTAIIDSCSLIPVDPLPDPINSCLPFGAFVPVVGHVDRVSCSPWICKDDNTIVATVAYTYDSALFLTTFTASLENDEFQILLRTSPERVGSQSIRSPLQWLPNSTDQRQNTLVYFTDDGCTKLDIICSEVPEMRETVIHSSSQPWSLFAGLQFISPRLGQVEVCAPRSQSDFQDEEALHLFHTDAQPRASSPSWAKRIDKLKRRFNRERIMNGNISVYVHGFATSPLGDFSAPSISFHPRHGLEYSIIAKQEANVVITRTHTASEDRFLMTDPSIIVSHAVAAEVVFQAVARLKKLDAIPDVGNIQQQVLRCMGYYGASDGNAPGALPPPDSLNMAVHELRTILLRISSAIQLRSQRMIEIALGQLTIPAPPDLSILKSLVLYTAHLPQWMTSGGRMSMWSAKLHQTILEKLVERDKLSSGHQNTQQTEQENVETCHICNAGIPFESLMWSRCNKGHEFARCGISFLSLQATGDSKSCCICGMQYLNEHKIDDLRKGSITNGHAMEDEPMQGADGVRLSEPLIRVLFAACDTCIYCGGKFTG
ncbi:transcription factor IIIC subunit delta N-term-domain-containing protein [Elsinoe ampelina]|uniref:Transcription factor IIIC subunit delta N-term-domain-containing protein n=1 Tax=Elsinoe ampelina TaxID=302913 RepID=A0A6A6FYS2_9PEZI|nr:transcription factor IIIC subunit delta N-term-domain-containing protein [Elsinoe ampelina]